jgi:beta-mannosidase
MAREQISLNGIWRYTPVARVTITGEPAWRRDVDALPPAGEMQVPSHWERAGLPDFAGTVRFERTLTLTKPRAGAAVWLICRGIDYWATITVNGRKLSEHEGYFQTREWDVTALLRDGENSFAIEVTCPREEPGSVWPHRKRVIKGVLSHWDCRPGSWDADSGQDVHSGGIWNDVLLEMRPAAHISRYEVQTWLTPPNELLTGEFLEHDQPVPDARVARVLVTTTLAGAAETDEPCWIEVSLGEHSARTGVDRWQGASAAVETVLTIAEPRLWWTWDHGEPYLYRCAVRLWQGERLLDEQERWIGIREVALDPETGIWTLNGRCVFVRGTNIVPTLWLAEYDAAMIDADIALLREAHINGVRMCVHVNREELYDALDRSGILVWQDFALQWGYQQTDAFIAEAVRQIKEMVRQFRHHPSIALWCCQNESTQFNREVLDPLLAHAAREEDSSRYVRPTSEFAEHLYYGWYGGLREQYLEQPLAAILSEFGAQALPSAEEMRAMVGASWPPDWRAMAYHDFQYDQTFNVARIPLGSTWEQFVAASQAYQAELLKTAIERFRRARYAPVGCLFQFMFMDCWPSVTWSVVSYERRPKAGFAALQEAYQPVLVGANLPRDVWLTYADLGSLGFPISIEPWIVNDRFVGYGAARLTVWLRDEHAGREAELARVACDVPADAALTLSHTPLAFPADWPTGDYTLWLRLAVGHEVISANHYRIHLLTSNPAILDGTVERR